MANKVASDFMLEEYDQIAKAYFGLREQMSLWFRVYLSLVAVPLTVTGALLQIRDTDQLPSLTSLPEIVAGLLVLVGVLGFLVLLAIVSTRTEMVMYARTINRVRGYFVALEQSESKNEAEQPFLQDHLVLPWKDDFPPFYEPGHSVFWMVIIVGLVNGLIFGLGAITLIMWPLWPIAVVTGASIFVHWLVYRLAARRREKGWSIGNRVPAYLVEKGLGEGRPTT